MSDSGLVHIFYSVLGHSKPTRKFSISSGQWLLRDFA